MINLDYILPGLLIPKNHYYIQLFSPLNSYRSLNIKKSLPVVSNKDTTKKVTYTYFTVYRSKLIHIIKKAYIATVAH